MAFGHFAGGVAEGLTHGMKIGEQMEEQKLKRDASKLGEDLWKDLFKDTDGDGKPDSLIKMPQAQGVSVPQSAPTSGSQTTSRAPDAKPILDFIGQHEAAGNYNAVYGNANNDQDLSKFTIDQIIQQQKAHGQKTGSSAVGRYQFLAGTLDDLKKNTGLTGSEQFTPELQDTLATALLKRRGYDDYLAGDLPPDKFAANLAQEWAALPAGPDGRGYYDGDKIGNKARVGWNDVQSVLTGAGVDPRMADTSGQPSPAVDPNTLPGRPTASAQPPSPVAQGIAQPPVKREMPPPQDGLTPEKLAEIHMRYSLKAAQNPYAAKQLAPVLEQIRGYGMAQHMAEFKGDDTSLDYMRHYGRGLGMFGQVMNPEKLVELGQRQRAEGREDRRLSLAENADQRDQARLGFAENQDRRAADQNDRAWNNDRRADDAASRQQSAEERTQEQHKIKIAEERMQQEMAAKERIYRAAKAGNFTEAKRYAKDIGYEVEDITDDTKPYITPAGKPTQTNWLWITDNDGNQYETNTHELAIELGIDEQEKKAKPEKIVRKKFETNMLREQVQTGEEIFLLYPGGTIYRLEEDGTPVKVSSIPQEGQQAPQAPASPFAENLPGQPPANPAASGITQQPSPAQAPQQPPAAQPKPAAPTQQKAEPVPQPPGQQPQAVPPQAAPLKPAAGPGVLGPNLLLGRDGSWVDLTGKVLWEAGKIIEKPDGSAWVLPPGGDGTPKRVR